MQVAILLLREERRENGMERVKGRNRREEKWKWLLRVVSGAPFFSCYCNLYFFTFFLVGWENDRFISQTTERERASEKGRVYRSV